MDRFRSTTTDNWLDDPFPTRAFQRVREFAPSARIANDSGVISELPTDLRELGGRPLHPLAPGVKPRGIIATLKLPEWSRAAAVPEWLAAFRAWGFRPRARQLSTGGRELCVTATPCPGA
jgi:hypothetical protein